MKVVINSVFLFPVRRVPIKIFLGLCPVVRGQVAKTCLRYISVHFFCLRSN